MYLYLCLCELYSPLKTDTDTLLTETSTLHSDVNATYSTEDFDALNCGSRMLRAECVAVKDVAGTGILVGHQIAVGVNLTALRMVAPKGRGTMEMESL